MDNPALHQAVKHHAVLLPIFIWDSEELASRQRGGASRWWLHHSIDVFRKSLAAAGSQLLILEGKPEEVLGRLLVEYGGASIYWNEATTPRYPDLEQKVTSMGVSSGEFRPCWASQTLCHPDELLKKDGTPYLVYTAFWNNFVRTFQARPIPKPRRLPDLPATLPKGQVALEKLRLLPENGWDLGFYDTWEVGEKAALRKVRAFIKQSLTDYEGKRNIPSVPGTSRLSPHFAFGELHPVRVMTMVQDVTGTLDSPQAAPFLKEIIWREFSHHLLFHFPQSVRVPIREKFLGFPWRNNTKWFRAWSQGLTGYPIVDAGMRELWTTGWMHNRVRMVVASFLTKHLNIPWQRGAEWFWDTLVDADLASNTMSWQWVAGCGVDAAPFFRIFNPITQGTKFDPNGDYIRLWCPELAQLPNKYIHCPWEASKAIRDEAGVRLGDSYPAPIVDHKTARAAALERYRQL